MKFFPLWFRVLSWARWLFYFAVIFYLPLPPLVCSLFGIGIVLMDTFMRGITEKLLVLGMVLEAGFYFYHVGPFSLFSIVFIVFLLWYIGGGIISFHWISKHFSKSADAGTEEGAPSPLKQSGSLHNADTPVNYKVSNILEKYLRTKQKIPYSYTYGKTSPFSNTIVKTERDYEQYLWAYAKECVELELSYTPDRKKSGNEEASPSKISSKTLKKSRFSVWLCIVLVACFVVLGILWWQNGAQAQGTQNEEQNIQYTVDVNSGNYVSSKKSDKYHRFSCRYANNISEENRTYYASASDAEADGKKPCSVCKPSSSLAPASPKPANIPLPSLNPTDILRSSPTPMDILRSYTN